MSLSQWAQREAEPVPTSRNGGTELPRARLLELYRRMLTIRRFEEAIHELYTRGTMSGLAHLSIGQEAVAVGACAALRRDDYITSTHRGHGHLIAKGGDLNRMMAEMLGRREGYNKGKGGTMHIADFSIGSLGANGVVGGGLAIAAGAGLSAQLRGTDQVTICFMGDGAFNQGLVYESMNMAAIWKLPVIYVLENNQYGEYTFYRKVTAGSVTGRAAAMDIPAVSVDGMDVLAVYSAADKYVRAARRGEGPAFVECITYRFRGHHGGDSGGRFKYRSNEEIDEWMQKDPIPAFERYLVNHGIVSGDDVETIQSEVGQAVSAAIAFAQAAPLPAASEVTEDVYA